MNEFEVLLVQNDLKTKGFANYKLQPGNDCIWASIHIGSGSWLDFYYIFRDGKIADIQVD